MLLNRGAKVPDLKRQLSTSKNKYATEMLHNTELMASGSEADVRFHFLTKWNIISR